MCMCLCVCVCVSLSHPAGLIHYWPKTNSVKEVMLLCELEEIIDMMHPADFALIHEVCVGV
jgi:hypothetical protein